MDYDAHHDRDLLLEEYSHRAPHTNKPDTEAQRCLTTHISIDTRDVVDLGDLGMEQSNAYILKFDHKECDVCRYR